MSLTPLSRSRCGPGEDLYEVPTAEPQRRTPCRRPWPCGRRFTRPRRLRWRRRGWRQPSEGQPRRRGSRRDRRHPDHQDQHQPVLHRDAEGCEGGREGNNVTITTAAGKADGDTDHPDQGDRGGIARGDSGILITPAGRRCQPSDRPRPAYRRPVRHRPGHPAGIPADTVDITFATDNFKAGELIGKWSGRADGRQEGDHRHARPIQRQDRERWTTTATRAS